MSRKILIKTIKKKLKKIVKPQGYIKGKKKRKSDLYDMVEFIRKIHIDDLNAKLEDQIRDRLKDKNEKLRIGFLVNEKAKWNCQSLLKEIQKNERMTAKIFLSLNERYKKFSHTDRTDDYLQHREFFMSIDKNLVDLYDYKKDWEKPIEEIDVDVLLYQQPWGMKDFPKRMAGRTLNVYMHYGFIMMANHSMHYNIGSFYPYLWKYFTQTEGHRLLHLNHDPSSFDKIVVTGYPKLDVYLEQESIPSCSI